MQKALRQIPRHIVTAFIESHDGLILLGRARPGGVYPDCWKRPGGGVEEGETLEEALLREMQEETGIDCRSAQIRLVRTDRVVEAEKTLAATSERVWVIMQLHEYHIILPSRGEEVLLAAHDDLTDLTWFQPHQLRDLSLSPPVESALREDGYPFGF